MPRIAVAPNRAITDYLESVRRAGGTPEVLAVTADTASDALDHHDGLLLTGGGDINPSWFGDAPHPQAVAAEPGRDETEFALIRAAVARAMPVLAICRGIQVLNVAFGGSLVQDIPSQVAGAVPHAVTEPRVALAHEVWLATDSRLARLLAGTLEDGDTCRVNSRHHQAVARVADGFVVTATAPDGLVEALERPGEAFCVGVQWHPENFWRTGEFRGLFEGFIDAARTYAAAR